MMDRHNLLFPLLLMILSRHDSVCSSFFCGFPALYYYRSKRLVSKPLNSDRMSFARAKMVFPRFAYFAVCPCFWLQLCRSVISGRGASGCAFQIDLFHPRAPFPQKVWFIWPNFRIISYGDIAESDNLCVPPTNNNGVAESDHRPGL